MVINGIQAENGGVLDLSNMQTISVVDNSDRYIIRALTGGTVDVSGVTSIPTGNVEFRAHNPGSVVDASSLPSFPPDSTLSTIYAQDGGEFKNSLMSNF